MKEWIEGYFMAGLIMAGFSLGVTSNDKEWKCRSKVKRIGVDIMVAFGSFFLWPFIIIGAIIHKFVK